MTIPVPNFRVPNRLITWMQVNNVRTRVPSAEGVFFKSRLHIDVRAVGLVNYARLVGKLPAEMEQVIAQCPSACVSYAGLIHHSFEVSDEIVNACAVDQNWVVKMATTLHKRIPHLEHKIVHPELYVEYASVLGRVPEMEDRILFSEDGADRLKRAFAALKLIERTGSSGYGTPTHDTFTDQRIRDLLKSEPTAVLNLMSYLGRRNSKLPAEFHSVFAGNGENLSKLSEHLRSRLSPELEQTWQGAQAELVQYATRYVRGRLSEDLECILIGNTKAIHDYAFQVVRGYSSPRLGNVLHNYMVMTTDNEDVKRYIVECDRTEEMKKLIESGIQAAG